MKFAPMNYHYLRYSLKKFLDKVEQSVFNSIDLYCSAPQFNIFDYSLFSLLELEKEIRRRDLSVMAMTPENCTYPVNFCTQDRGTRESSIRYYQRAIDTAEFLGCHKVQISTGFGYFDQSPEDAWKYCRDSLQQLGAYCEKKECGADAGGVEGNNNKCADKKFRSETNDRRDRLISHTWYGRSGSDDLRRRKHR